MSCKACDEAQDKNSISYYRWSNANVELRGCDQHLGEIYYVLNLMQSDREELVKLLKQAKPLRPVIRVRQL